jgi:hypothetical protein
MRPSECARDLMKVVRFRRWTISVDAEATRLAQSPQGGAQTCGCSFCRNFVTVRERIFPEEVLQLFGELGLDHRRDVEAVHYGRLPTGLHSYGTWFHLVGRIDDGKDAAVPLVGGNGFTFDLEPVGDGFSLGFTSKVDLVSEAFAGGPVAQIDIMAEAPWVIPDDEPT